MHRIFDACVCIVYVYVVWTMCMLTELSFMWLTRIVRDDDGEAMTSAESRKIQILSTFLFSISILATAGTSTKQLLCNDFRSWRWEKNQSFILVVAHVRWIVRQCYIDSIAKPMQLIWHRPKTGSEHGSPLHCAHESNRFFFRSAISIKGTCFKIFYSQSIREPSRCPVCLLAPMPKRTILRPVSRLVCRRRGNVCAFE